MDKKCKIVLVALAVLMVGALVYCAINISPKTVDPQAEIVSSAKEKLKVICSRFGTLAIDFPRENIFFVDYKEGMLEKGEYLLKTDKIIIYFPEYDQYDIKFRGKDPILKQTITLTHELIHAQCYNFGKEDYSAFWIEGMASLITTAGFTPTELKKCDASQESFSFDSYGSWGLYYGLKVADIYRVAELMSRKTNTNRDQVMSHLIKLFMQNDTHTFDEYIDSALGKDTCKTYFKNAKYIDPFAEEVEKQEVQAINELYIKNGITGKINIEYPASILGYPTDKNCSMFYDIFTPKKNR